MTKVYKPINSKYVRTDGIYHNRTLLSSYLDTFKLNSNGTTKPYYQKICSIDVTSAWTEASCTLLLTLCEAFVDSFIVDIRLRSSSGATAMANQSITVTSLSRNTTFQIQDSIRLYQVSTRKYELWFISNYNYMKPRFRILSYIGNVIWTSRSYGATAPTSTGTVPLFINETCNSRFDNGTEWIIGNWGGATAYRKVFVADCTKGTTGSISTGLSNVRIFNLYGTFIGSSFTIPINFYNNLTVFCHADAKGTKLTFANNFESGTIHVVIEYVKS